MWLHGSDQNSTREDGEAGQSEETNWRMAIGKGEEEINANAPGAGTTWESEEDARQGEWRGISRLQYNKRSDVKNKVNVE